jgi:class I fructose-bisphosphate aldolase
MDVTVNAKIDPTQIDIAMLYAIVKFGTSLCGEMLVPADVSPEMRDTYIENYLRATFGTGRLMLFAGDQKFEHLNDDFCGKGIDPADNDPEHLFRIANRGVVGVFAAQLGLIVRYGQDYTGTSYLVKMNSKTHLVGTHQKDPRSLQLYTLDIVLDTRKRIKNIVGVGYTIYLGSEYEAEMLAEAGRLVAEAHAAGLIVVLWIYPRGKAVVDEKDAHLIAGAAGTALCLGADFVKVNAPKAVGDSTSAELLEEASTAAGRTGLVCAGGSQKDPQEFLQQLYDQIHTGGASGNATGRNIHQRPLDEAVRLTQAISAITLGNQSVGDALLALNGAQPYHGPDGW